MQFQNINRGESEFGSSYLLGNRKGLTGLKHKKREINQVYISQSKQQPIENRFAKTLEQVNIFSSWLCLFLRQQQHLGYSATENIESNRAVKATVRSASQNALLSNPLQMSHKNPYSNMCHPQPHEDFRQKNKHLRIDTGLIIPFCRNIILEDFRQSPKQVWEGCQLEPK